jgi:hypothetical protein
VTWISHFNFGLYFGKRNANDADHGPHSLLRSSTWPPSAAMMQPQQLTAGTSSRAMMRIWL